MRRKAQAIAFEIGKKLIDDQQPIPRARAREGKQRAGVEAPTTGIVWIAKNSAWRMGKRVERSHLHHPASRSFKAPRIFAIGWPEDCDRGMRKEPGQQRDQQLRAWDGSNHAPIRNAISLCCHRLEPRDRLRLWQSRPGRSLNCRNWIGEGIDPRRKIDERFWRLRKQTPRLDEAAAVGPSHRRASCAI